MSERLIRKFTEMIGLFSRGKFEQRLDQELEAVIESLQQQPHDQGKATLTITIAFKYQNGRMDIVPAVKAKLPEGPGFTDTPFWIHENALSLQHPNQIDMWEPRNASSSSPASSTSAA